MIDDLRQHVLSFQMPSGAFPSVAHLPGGAVADENAFVTALVVERLLRLESDGEIAGAVDRAVEYILRCEEVTRPGMFRFYPRDAHPHWIGESLAPDADDTALCMLVLLRAGARSRERARQQFLGGLDRYCIRRCPRGADWFRAGVFPTWLDSKRTHNPIDVCVNLNALTFMHVAGVDLSGYGILEMAASAVEGAADHHDGLASALPYYPRSSELGYALGRANEAGVPDAERLLDRFRSILLADGADDGLVCSSLGRRVVWTSPVLQAARRWICLAGVGAAKSLANATL